MKKICWVLLWLLAFSMVNYPIGMFAGLKIYPFILGLPFSLFYFWTSYSFLILAGIMLAWQVFRG